MADSGDDFAQYLNEANPADPCHGTDLSSAFAAVTTKCGHSIGYVRFFVAWDTIAWDPSGQPGWSNCQASADFAYNGAATLNNLKAQLQAAQADNLTPLISIVGTTKAGLAYGEPSFPTAYDYACGVYELMIWSTLSGLHVPAWEVYNEPDSSGGLVHDGLSGAEAAAEYYWIAEVARAQASAVDSGVDGSDVLAAGAFNAHSVNDPNSNKSGHYIHDYIYDLTSVFGQWPSLWSFHPYDDIDADGISGTFTVAASLRSDYSSAGQPLPHVWLTEAAVDLTASATTYLGTPVSCNFGPYRGTLGACVDGNPTAQANATADFLSLPSLLNQYFGSSIVPITRIYWYDFVMNKDFGAALVVVESNGQVTLRPSWCVLVGFSASAGASNPACQDVHNGLTDVAWLSPYGL